MAPIYSSVANAQDTEHLSSTEKHIQDINLKETASRKVVKNSYTNDIVQAFTENDTQVEAIDTKTDAPMNHTADAKPRDCMVFFLFSCDYIIMAVKFAQIFVRRTIYL